MDRLTERTPDGNVNIILAADPDGAYSIIDAVNCEYHNKALAVANRLAAYEDTGRNPDEIAALDHDVAMFKQSARLANEMAKENAALKKALDVAMKSNKNHKI